MRYGPIVSGGGPWNCGPIVSLVKLFDLCFVAAGCAPASDVPLERQRTIISGSMISLTGVDPAGAG